MLTSKEQEGLDAVRAFADRHIVTTDAQDTELLRLVLRTAGEVTGVDMSSFAELHGTDRNVEASFVRQNARQIIDLYDRLVELRPVTSLFEAGLEPTIIAELRRRGPCPFTTTVEDRQLVAAVLDDRRFREALLGSPINEALAMFFDGGYLSENAVGALIEAYDRATGRVDAQTQKLHAEIAELRQRIAELETRLG